SSTSACIYYFFCFPIQRSPCSLLVPYTTLFRSHGQRTQRSAVVVQFGGPLGHPADQPDVELVVADQAGVPAFVAGQARRRQQVVVTAAEHVGGEAVGGVQQVGQAQPGGRHAGQDPGTGGNHGRTPEVTNDRGSGTSRGPRKPRQTRQHHRSANRCVTAASVA